jgi:hypothetical protein
MKKLLAPLCLILILVFSLMPGCSLFAPKLPVVNAFEANPPSISTGGSSTLTWNISGAASVGIDQGIGNVALTGSRVVAPGATTTYTLTATNASGSITATCQVVVAGTPAPPAAGLPVITFTANPPGVTAGNSSTLSWNVSNATSTTIDQGIGNVAASGSTIVLPVATTTYTLTASNAAGSSTATTQVIVSSGGYTPPPTPTPFAVLGVTAMAEPTAFAGACPKNFIFSAVITANGAGTVTYRWDRSDGISSPLQTAVFAAAGTQTVSTGWTRDASGAYWVRAHTLAPNEVISNQAGFTLNCEVPGEVTNVTASVTPQSYGGPCPKNFSCSATITVNGPCTVTYVWERLPDLGSSPVQTITFAAAGSKTVTTGWPLDKTQMYGLIVRTLTPNVKASSQYLFALECQ